MNDEQDVNLSSDDVDDSVVIEESLEERVKTLKEKLKEAEKRAKENLDAWQRAQADFMNLRKRDEEDKQDFVKFAKSDIVSELIPTLDALSSAVSHGIEGVEQIQNLILKTLKQHGLEELNPLGEPFDPAKHEAVAMQPTTDKGQDHKILDVLQKGYILNGKILRPAKVKVGEFTN